MRGTGLALPRLRKYKPQALQRVVPTLFFLQTGDCVVAQLSQILLAEDGESVFLAALVFTGLGEAVVGAGELTASAPGVSVAFAFFGLCFLGSGFRFSSL